MLQNINTYLLNEDIKAPVFVLRHSEVFIETSKGIREIKYVKGANSIFADDISPKLKRTPNEFLNGRLDVPKSDKIRNEYLQKHPDFGVKFRLLDIEGEAEKELEKLDAVYKALAELETLDASQQEAVAVELFGDLATQNWKDEKTRLELKKYVMDDKNLTPNGVQKAQHFLSVMKDEQTEVKFLIINALRKNIISISADKTAIKWESGEDLISVPVGKKPINEMATFLMSKKGTNTLQSLAEKMKKSK